MHRPFLLAASLLPPLTAAGAQAALEPELRLEVPNPLEPELRAMGEPGFEGSDADRFARRFRLLMLPAQASPWAIRIDEEEGGARVRVVELDSASERVVRDRRFVLAAAERRAFVHELRMLQSGRAAGAAARSCPRARYVLEVIDSGGIFGMRGDCAGMPRLRRLLAVLEPLRSR